MATNVIMPALELAQETGKLLRWIKAPGDTVRKGEPIAEIETDKVTIELEAPASGVLSAVTAQEGDVIPVGHTIAQIAAANEAPAPTPTLSPEGRGSGDGLADHGGADDRVVDERAALLPGARGQRDAARGVASEGAQADRRARHLHGPAGQAGGGDAGAASARERIVEGRDPRAPRRYQHRPGGGARGRALPPRTPQRRHAGAQGARHAPRGPGGPRPVRQAPRGRDPRRRL